MIAVGKKVLPCLAFTPPHWHSLKMPTLLVNDLIGRVGAPEITISRYDTISDSPCPLLA